MIVRVFVSLLIAVWTASGAARAGDDKIRNILRPEIVPAISNTVAYANPNRQATKLVDAEIRNDPNIYPPAEVRARLFFDKAVTPQYERLRTRAWTKVKTGS